MICLNCKNKFKYNNLLRAIWSISGYKELECSCCKTKYKINQISRILIALLIALPIFMNNLNFFICYLILMILASPYLIKFKPIN